MIEIIPNWHPIFVHFTVAFLSLLAALQLLIWFWKKPDQAAALLFSQRWMVVLTTAAIVVTVIAGIHAYFTVNHDGPSHVAMTDHRNWALATTITYLFSVVLFFWKPALRQTVAGMGIILAVLLVGVTAYKGGELVYRYGIGVMSLPEASGSGHDHHHESMPEHKDTSEKSNGGIDENDQLHQAIKHHENKQEDTHDGHDHEH